MRNHNLSSDRKIRIRHPGRLKPQPFLPQEEIEEKDQPDTCGGCALYSRLPNSKENMGQCDLKSQDSHVFGAQKACRDSVNRAGKKRRK